MEKLMKTQLSEKQAQIIKNELDKLKIPKNGQISAKELSKIFKKAKIDLKEDLPDDAEIEFRLFYDTIDKASSGSSSKNSKLRSKKPFLNPVDRLTPVELEDFKKAFAVLDKENEGTIDADEFRKALEEFGVNGDPRSIRLMIEEVDKNKGGKINFDDFVGIMTGAKRFDLNNKDDLKILFDEFDIDGDGIISQKDLETVNDELGEDAQNDEIKRMILTADETDDNEITFDDFYYIMTVGAEQNNERKLKLAEEAERQGGSKKSKKKK